MRTARQAGVRRIIYLGGLGAESQSLSAHLRSRQEVADILRSSGVPTIEFRASIVIGSGNLCFEMIRALAQRLPVMICPRWVGVKAQPIAVEDVVAYLLQALELPVGDAAVFEIGGADQVSYGEIMQEYARQCGLRRWMIPVPVLTPRLSSLWLGLVTPIYARIGRKLVDSMRNPTLVRNPSALKVFDIRPKGTLIVIAGNPKTGRRMTFLIASLCILIFIILTILLLRDDRAPWTPSTLHPSMFLQSSAIN